MLVQVLNRRRYSGALAGVLALVPWLAWWGAIWAPDCPFSRVLGLPCPGCGLGRGVRALGQMDLGAAMSCYPPLLPLVVVYLVVLGLAVWHAGGGDIARFIRRALAAGGIVVAVAVVVNWVHQLVVALKGYDIR